ncbi:MAG: hypothetical protein Q9223_001013 [Gallowayella weberi]
MDNFRTLVKQQVSKLEGGAKSDLLRKYSCLIAFDFEAAARLKTWTSLGELIGVRCALCKDSIPADVGQESELCGDNTIYNVMADIVLASEAPNEVVIATLQQIVNLVWLQDLGNIDRLARWIRCLLTLALSSNIEMAENLIDQVYSIVQSSKARTVNYPAEELEWVATTTFNRAIDFYCAAQDGACRRWAEKAMGLAALMGDERRLHRLLQDKFLGLAWDR